MTDIEKFKELYKSLGIECTEYTDDKGYRCIKLSEFNTEIVFDESGKFITHGFWE